MKQIKIIETAEETRAYPTSAALAALAKLPEDIQKMALAFAWGLKASERKGA